VPIASIPANSKESGAKANERDSSETLQAKVVSGSQDGFSPPVGLNSSGAPSISLEISSFASNTERSGESTFKCGSNTTCRNFYSNELFHDCAISDVRVLDATLGSAPNMEGASDF
jgi:hypothetical protein